MLYEPIFSALPKASESDRALLYRAIVMGEELEFKELGEKDDYVSVPFPFRSGDIVTPVGGQNCDVGVFASCKDDEKNYDRKALLRREAVTICGKEFAVCDSLKALHRSRTFSVQDLLALPKSAFTLQLNTKRVFGAVNVLGT